MRLLIAGSSLALVVVGLTSAPALASAPSTAPSSDQGVATPTASSTAAPNRSVDWQEPSKSVDKAPKKVVKSVGKKETAKVVAVSIDGDKPVVDTTKVKGTKEAKKVVKKAQKMPDLLYVGVDTKVKAVDPPQGETPVGAQTSVNDPKRGSQWALNTLAAETVWQQATGEGVTIAVLDTGIGTHVDMPNDVIAGLDATGEGDSRDDGHGHGTHVAGSIAAATDNGVGIAGYAPDARLMAVKVLNKNGSGYSSWIANGIIAATDSGADVINMSLGGGSAGAMSAAVAYAQSQGVAVVAAAGNSRGSGSPRSYPAALPDVLGVAATDSQDQYASFSNAGDWVDVAAPGVSILSTVGSGYASWSGTSMAAPHAAAAAGLLIGAGDPDPLGTLMSTATDLGDSGRDDDYGHGLIDTLAALDSLDVPDGTEVPSAPQNVVATQGDPGSVAVSWSAPADDGGAAVSKYSVFAEAVGVSTSESGSSGCSTSSGTTECTVTGLTAGTYTFSVKAKNAVGWSAVAVSNSVTVVGIPDNAGNTKATATPLSFDEPISELIGKSGDYDYWKLTAGSAGALSADLSSLPADYDMSLYNSSGGLLDYSQAWGTTDENVAKEVAAGTYYLKVYGYNGAFDASDPYELVAELAVDDSPTAPAAPTDLGAALTDTDVALSWTAPDDGGAEITGYKVQQKTGTGSWQTVVADTESADSEFTVSDLSAGTHKFRVAAINSVGMSDFSAASAAVTIADVPSAPRYVTARAGNGFAKVWWAAPKLTNGSAVTGYQVQASTDGANWAAVGTATKTRLKVTGLTNGQRIKFRVLAENASGWSEASQSSRWVRPLERQRKPWLKQRRNGKLVVKWQPVAGATSYEVRQRIRQAGSGWSSWQTLSGSAHLERKNRSVNAVKGNKVKVQVRAVAQENTSHWSPTAKANLR